MNGLSKTLQSMLMFFAVFCLQSVVVGELTTEESKIVPKQKLLRTRKHQQEGRQLQPQLPQRFPFRSLYSLSVSEFAPSTVSRGCITPERIRFQITCGERIETLDEEESFGLMECDRISASTLQCPGANSTSQTSHKDAIVVACLASATTSNVDVQAVVLEDMADCSPSAESVVGATISRTLSVSRICRIAGADSLVNLTVLGGTDAQCGGTSEANTLGGDFDFGQSCTQLLTCNNNDLVSDLLGVPSCTRNFLLPAFSRTVSADGITDNCLWPILSIDEVATDDPFANGQINEARYEVSAFINQGSSCSLADGDSSATFTCSGNGTIRVLLTNTQHNYQQLRDNCGLESRSTLVCQIFDDNSSIVRWKLACSGNSLDDVSLRVDIDPGELPCESIAQESVSYSMLLLQLCEGSDSPIGIGYSPNIYSQQCSPLSSSNVQDTGLDYLGTDVFAEICLSSVNCIFGNAAFCSTGVFPTPPIASVIHATDVNSACLTAIVPTTPTATPVPTTSPTAIAVADNAPVPTARPGVRSERNQIRDNIFLDAPLPTDPPQTERERQRDNIFNDLIR